MSTALVARRLAAVLAARAQRTRRPRATVVRKHRRHPVSRQLREVTEPDIPRLVDGTLVQARLLKLSPVAATRDVLTELFYESFDAAQPPPARAAHYHEDTR